MSVTQDEILELLKRISEKVDKLVNSKTENPASVAKVASAKGKIEIVTSSMVKPSEVVKERVEAEKEVKERRVCPECGATEFNAVDDKTRPLHYISGAPIFAKKYQCKKCGYELE